MEPYGKLQNDTDSTPPNPEPSTSGIILQVQKPKTYPIPKTTFILLGSIQMAIGIISIILGIVGVCVNHDHVSIVGYGIWCGLLFLLSGAFTTKAANKKTLCWVITCMVMSIISASFSLVTLGFGAAELGRGIDERNYHNEYHDTEYYYHPELNFDLAIATGVFMIVGSITEAVLAIICAAITCAKTCCRPVSYQLVQTNPSMQYTAGQQQVIYMTAPAPSTIPHTTY